jgi:hypothetical protein
MEICRIFDDVEFCKNMKVSLAGTWIPRILSYIESSDKPMVKKLRDEMEQAINDGLISETGNFI